MIAFVALMFLNIILPYLRFVNSPGLDMLDQVFKSKEVVDSAKRILWSVSIISSLMSIYFALVALGAWLFVKNES
jgi:hypothetical protein